MAFWIIYFKRADDLFEVLRLILQRLRGSGGLLHQRSILLGHLIHLVNGVAHAFNACGLVRAGR